MNNKCVVINKCGENKCGVNKCVVNKCVVNKKFVVNNKSLWY